MGQQVSRWLADVAAALESTHENDATCFLDLRDELVETGYLRPNVVVHALPLDRLQRMVEGANDHTFEEAVLSECMAPGETSGS